MIKLYFELNFRRFTPLNYILMQNMSEFTLEPVPIVPLEPRYLQNDQLDLPLSNQVKYMNMNYMAKYCRLKQTNKLINFGAFFCEINFKYLNTEQMK